MKPLLIIVDDDPDDVEFFQLAIKDVKADCDFKSFDNGSEFLEFMKTDPWRSKPVAAAMDINMPIISGIELLKRLKDDNLIDKISVYIMSTAYSNKYKEEALHLGAKCFYTKPVSSDDWEVIVNAIMEGVKQE
jgi:CheY-like chemotaxis protein